MTIHLSHANIWVHDQDEALAFYTDKLGLEVREDVTLPELGGYRWLTVGPVGQPDVAFTLNVPGPPVFDPNTTEQVKDVMAKGGAGSFIFGTEDCRADYEELKARGGHEPPIAWCSGPAGTSCRTGRGSRRRCRRDGPRAPR